jgi:hypothetical protein
VAPVAAGMGISIEETVAAIGLLSDAGIKGCYDEDTEVLTLKGFKKWSDVSMDDYFATINPNTQEIEYQKPSGLVNTTYKGKMYVVKNKHIDLKVTPNHWMYVRRRGKDSFERIRAEDLFGKDVEYLCTGNWKGNNKDYIILEGFEQGRGNWKKEIKPLKIDMALWVEFLGYYLAEGCCDYHKGSYRIRITQNKSATFDNIKNCLDKLPFHYNIVKNNNSFNFVIINQQLYNYLSKFGNCYAKYIPEDIKDLDKKYLYILYEAFREGDGDAQGCLYTSSLKLRDDFIEVLLKLGFGASSKKEITIGQESVINGRKVYSKQDGWKVFINKTQLTPSFYQSEYNSPKHSSRLKGLGTNIVEKWEDYEGRIYCAEVPNHLLIVRRNGKVIVCGNSMAGTTLRRAFSELLSPTAKAEKILTSLGVNAVTSSGKLRPFADILRDLKTTGLTAAQAMEIFGQRGGPGMIALLTRGSGALSSLTNDLRNSQGAAEDMSQAFRTTVKGRTRDLIASIVDLGLAFSEKFKKPLSDSIFAIRNFVVDIVNIGNRTGIFKSIIAGIQDVLKPISGLVKGLAADFKAWLGTLTAKDISEFFSGIKKGIETFIESFKKGEVGKIVKDTLNIFIGLGKIVIGTLQNIVAVWLSLPEGFRNIARPIIIIVALVTSLFGGLLNIVFLMVALNALWASLGLQVTLSQALLLGFKPILIGIGGLVGIIGAGLAGWTIGSLMSELAPVKAAFSAIYLLVAAIGPALKVLSMTLSVANNPLLAWNKDFKKELSATLEELKIKTGALKELDWLGPKVGENKEEKVSAGNKTGINYFDMGGKSVDIDAMLNKQDLDSLKKMLGQTERMENVLGASDKTNMLADLQERINEVEKLVMQQEGNLAALNRQTIKPEADRTNKSRIGAGLE